MFTKSLVAGMLLSLTPMIASAAGPLVGATDPAVLASLIEDYGYPAEITVDSVGDPLIKSSAHGYNFDMFFYDCTDNVQCQAVQFAVTFDLEDGMSLTSAQDFNRDKRWVKVYMDEESDPRVEMDVNLRGGVSPENFTDSFDWWLIMMGEFVEYIDF